MGQRANPYGLRVGINKQHQSVWYAKTAKEYARLVKQDYDIRFLINKRFNKASVSGVVITRTNQLCVTIHAKLVGHIIGKKGVIIDQLRKDLENLCGEEVTINVQEIAKPDTDAMVVANEIALALQAKGAGFKMVIKRAMQATMDAGALGIKILLSGRLGGAEIARKEPFATGSVPLQTLQADISFGMATSFTAAGTIGVKVFIFNGMYRGKFNPFANMTDRFSQKANEKISRINEELDKNAIAHND